MPSIQDDTARAALIARLNNLSPTSQARFGTLDAARMLCHMQDQIRVALGTAPCRERKTVYRFGPLRWIALALPVPKGKIQTVKEMLATQPGEWDRDFATLRDLVEQLSGTSTTAPHPAFGPLSPAAWCKLTWKHLDHHLTQFGV